MKESFCEIINRIEKEYCEKTAFYWYDEEKREVASVNYKCFCADVRRCVSFLEERLGIPMGKHIAILAKNSYEYAVAVFACLGSGAISIPLNIEKSLDDILYELELADADAILHDSVYIDREPGLALRFEKQLLNIKGFYGYAEAVLSEIYDDDRLAMILFTSGTTAKSKGVMLSHKNIGMHFRHPHDQVDPCNIVFIVLPLFHISGQIDLFMAVFWGKSISICSGFREVYRDIRLLPGDSMTVVPSLLNSFYKDVIKGHRERLGAIRVFRVVGASPDVSILSEMIRSGFFIMQNYGMTENVGYGTINMSQELQYLNSVGKTCKGVEYKIINGEFCVRGDAVMLGYYKDPEGTAQVFDSDGWFHTGDLARMDGDGYYYLTGRKKNLIILASGENINPEELEALLLKEADIHEVIVKEKDRKICAEIFCENEKREEIRNFITEIDRELPLYKQITLIEFRNVPFERTETGKIKRAKG